MSKRHQHKSSGKKTRKGQQQGERHKTKNQLGKMAQAIRPRKKGR